MSSLITHSPDLQRLADDGYALEIRSGHLIIKDLPYLKSDQSLGRGTLVSKLQLAGDQTIPPTDHTVYFIGEVPYQQDGVPVRGILHPQQSTTLAEDLIVDRMFSNKPDGGYPDYYAKMTRYIDLICPHALARYPGIQWRTYQQVVETPDEDVFLYRDTAAIRTETLIANDRLKGQRIGIIGVGGTGSYILDMIAKCRVKLIKIFDYDIFLQHNAFRTPGAASLEQIKKKQNKADYLAKIYSVMRKGIEVFPFRLDEAHFNELEGLDFVFLSLDDGPSRYAIAHWLFDQGTPFIDVGMGLEQSDTNAIFGLCRVTLVVKGDAVALAALPTGEDKTVNLYKTAIQTVESNALNAAIAVIRWKRHMGFYYNGGNDWQVTYNITTGSTCLYGDKDDQDNCDEEGRSST